jgi:hypothetical protein
MSSGDEEETAFRLDLNVPGQVLKDEERRQAIEWLEQLAAQLASEEGKTLAIQVTGVFDEHGGYPPDQDGSSNSPQPACAARTSEVSIMLCPGRRPYA